MHSIPTFLTTRQWLEASWEEMDRRLRAGLQQVLDGGDPDPGIRNIVLSMHIYDSLPEALFTLSGALDKSSQLVLHVSAMFEGRAREIVNAVGERMITHEDFHRDLKELGYFMFFIRLFYAFTQSGWRGADPPLANAFDRAVEMYRALLRSGDLRLRLIGRTFEARKQLLWDRVLLASTGEQRLAAAVSAEQLKARLFLDAWWLRTRGSNSDDSTRETEPMAGEVDIRTTLGRHVSDLLPGDSPATPGIDEFAAYTPALLYCYVDAALTGTEAAPAAGIGAADINAICSTLTDDTAYLSYFQINDYLFVMLVRRGTAPEFFGVQTYAGGDPGSRALELEAEYSRVTRVLESLASHGVRVHLGERDASGARNERVPGDVRQALSSLHAMLLDEPASLPLLEQPLASSLQGVETLLVSSCFPIQSVPLGALYDGEHYVGETYSVAYVPNAAWAAAAGPAERTVDSALVLANPGGDLRGAEREGVIVADILREAGIPATLRNGADVNREWLLDNLGRFDLVHFAGHGSFSVDASSYLDLAGEPLSIRDILDLDWRPQFVFLNACRSGERQFHSVEETLSLTSAILAKGAVAAVTSLWPVGDESAVGFAREFWTACCSGRPVGAAVRAATAGRAAAGDSPAAWCGYVLNGLPWATLRRGRE